MMASNKYTDDGLLYIEAFNPYIHGAVGTDIKLSFSQKIKIFFCRGISVCVGNIFEMNEQEDKQ